MHPFKEYLSLSKPRIVSMVLVTTSIGFLLGGGGVGGGFRLVWTLVGTALAVAGSAALNNYLERDLDARMERTRKRALPGGRIEPAHALAYGILCVLAGVGITVARVNLLTGFLILLSAFLYVVVYTPLKRVTWLNTSIGAIPGALPPVSGWAAATGNCQPMAWVLFLILYAWQHPHFYSIAWMYRNDYRQAGFQMLSVIDADGSRLIRHTLGYAVVLLAVSILPALVGMTGLLYAVGAFALGLLVLRDCIRFGRSRNHGDARRVLKASVLYLPLILGLIATDSLL